MEQCIICNEAKKDHVSQINRRWKTFSISVKSGLKLVGKQKSSNQPALSPFLKLPFSNTTESVTRRYGETRSDINAPLNPLTSESLEHREQDDALDVSSSVEMTQTRCIWHHS